MNLAFIQRTTISINQSEAIIPAHLPTLYIMPVTLLTIHYLSKAPPENHLPKDLLNSISTSLTGELQEGFQRTELKITKTLRNTNKLPSSENMLFSQTIPSLEDMKSFLIGQ